MPTVVKPSNIVNLIFVCDSEKFHYNDESIFYDAQELLRFFGCVKMPKIMFVCKKHSVVHKPYHSSDLTVLPKDNCLAPQNVFH